MWTELKKEIADSNLRISVRDKMWNSHNQKSPKNSLFEKVVCGIAFILSSEAFIPLFRQEKFPYIHSIETMVWCLWFFIYLFSLTHLFRVKEQIFRLVASNKLTFILLILVMSSIFWSTSYGTTLYKIFPLVGTYVFAMYLAVRFSWQQLLELLYYSLLLCLISSLIFIIFIPEVGIHHEMYQGAWRGIYPHKNTLGRMMLLTMLVSACHGYLNNKISRVIFPVGLSCFVLLQTTSTTSLVLLVILLATILLMKLFSFHRYLVIALICYAGMILLVVWNYVVHNYILMLAWFGKDTTLTGRTELWQSVLNSIYKKVWLGYGFGGFWLGPEGPSSDVLQQVGWGPKFSHNGYLEILLQIGLIGLLIFSLVFFRNIICTFKLLYTPFKHLAIFSIAFLVFTFVYNFTENTLLLNNFLFWILFILLSFQITISINLVKEQVS